jgi:hydrogenase maturation protease
MKPGMKVLCCGHEDKGDDAVGPLVFQALRGMNVDAKRHTGDGLALIEAWRDADSVIIVDAVVTGRAAGTICIVELTQELYESSKCPTRALAIPEAIKIARILNRLPREVWIYGIEGVSFQAGTPACAEVLQSVEELARRIRDKVDAR